MLIQALQNPALYDHAAGTFQLIETHISWIILTGPYAYKIKKPVNFGFLDFSTLEKRRYFCQQELRLNRRLAPQLYQNVIPITGTAQSPQLNGSGTPIEYAVKMTQFPQQAQLDRVLNQSELHPSHIDQLAKTIAEFHAQADASSADTAFGSPSVVHHFMAENFDQIQPLLTQLDDLRQLQRLQTWSNHQFTLLTPMIEQRKRDGFVRECHGDMHLANMALLKDNVVIFDCIEFNDSLRWIDSISEVAFTAMDLDDRQRPDLAARLLNGYMQHSGDYHGVALLRFYQVYRAMVRAKVACLRLHQADLSDAEKHTIETQYRGYATLAEHYTRATAPVMCLTHGVSGSGKTSISQPLLEHFGMIRIRSDVERKRLFGLRPDEHSTSATGQGIYTPQASRATYDRLSLLARTIIEAGFSTIVDATCLKRDERKRFRTLSKSLGVPFVILDFHVDEALARQWIIERADAGDDASEATVDVLQRQLASREPLNSDEYDHVIHIDSSCDDAASRLIEQLDLYFERR